MGTEDLLDMMEHAEALEQARRGEITVKREEWDELREKQRKFQNTVQLIAGDPSDDGHGKYETFMIETNLTPEQLKNAYNKGCRKLKIDFESVASDWEDTYLPRDVEEQFKNAGFQFEGKYLDRYDYADEDSPIILDMDLFAELYLFLVKAGSPDFEYQKTDMDSIDIGGYGLFY